MEGKQLWYKRYEPCAGGTYMYDLFSVRYKKAHLQTHPGRGPLPEVIAPG